MAPLLLLLVVLLGLGARMAAPAAPSPRLEPACPRRSLLGGTVLPLLETPVGASASTEEKGY